MSRTTRHDNGFNKGRDDNPAGAKHWPDSSHPNGFNTVDDDHGHYGAGGARFVKKEASAARRIYQNNVIRRDLREHEEI